MRTPILVAVLACCSFQGALAQDIVWQVVGDRFYLYGASSIFVDDIDGDGYEDVAHAAGRWDGTMGYIWSAMLVRSGRDGRILREITIRPIGSSGIGNLISCGDMDGDGIRDYAGQHHLNQQPHRVEAFSGKTGALLWSVSGPHSDEFGDKIAGNLDVNGDGRPDLIVNARRENNDKGAIHLFSHDGSLLYSIRNIQAGQVGGIGDIDGDGCDDFGAGAFEPTTGGGVHVYSGRTGNLIRVSPGQFFGDGIGGGSILGCGDIDGDGVPDYVGSSFGALGPGVVIVFSGRTGQRIYVWRQPAGPRFGWRVACGDLDRDGIQDLLVSSWDSVAKGLIYYFSGRDGKLVTKIWPRKPITSGSELGSDPFAIGRPHPGDVFPTITAIESKYGPPIGRFPNLGRVNLMRSVPSGVRGQGQACSGPLSSTPHIGFRELSTQTARIHLTGAPPGAAAFLIIGSSDQRWGPHQLPLSLANLGAQGCSLYTSVDLLVPVKAGSTGNDTGYAFVDVPRPIGGPLYAQWLVLGKGPTSKALGKPASLPVAFSEGLVF